MAANDQQPEHYRNTSRGGEAHWDRMWRLYREAWFVGNITKYVERYKLKDGMKDLLKAKHYLEKLIELEKNDKQENTIPDWVDMTEVDVTRKEITKEDTVLSAGLVHYYLHGEIACGSKEEPSICTSRKGKVTCPICKQILTPSKEVK